MAFDLSDEQVQRFIQLLLESEPKRQSDVGNEMAAVLLRCERCSSAMQDVVTRVLCGVGPAAPN